VEPATPLSRNWEYCQEFIPSLPAHFESIRWLRYCDHCLEATYIAANDRISGWKASEVHISRNCCYLEQTWHQSRPVSRSWGLADIETGWLYLRCPGAADGDRGCSPSRTSRDATPPRRRCEEVHRVFSRCPQLRRSFLKTRRNQGSDMYHRLQSLLLGTAEVLRRLFLVLLNDVLPTTQFALRWLGDHVLKFKIIREYWRYRSRIRVYVCMCNYLSLSLSHYRQLTMECMLPRTKIEIWKSELILYKRV